MMPNDDLKHAAANAAIRFFKRYAPDEAEKAAPYLVRLFAALQNGHAYIRLSEDETAEIRQLENIAGNEDKPLILRGRRLFLGKVWQLEKKLAQQIYRIASSATEDVDWMSTSQNLSEWFSQKGSEGQRDAAALALLQNFMLITGGPGTGKTTTVAKLLGLICTNRRTLPSIALAAPTGKAAAHMARALHRALDGFDMPDAVRAHLEALEGQTVHRLLKLRPPQMKPAFNADHPLPFEVLVVDEASMLDISLLTDLLEAVPSGSRIIFLGDEHQLPSVGLGAVLSALSQETILDPQTAEKLSVYLPQHRFKTAAQTPPLSQNTAHLSFSHRFGENSGIGCLARAVVNGNPLEAWEQFSRFPESLAVMDGNLKQQAQLLYRRHKRYWQAVDDGNLEAAFGCAADAVVLTAWKKDAEDFNAAYLARLQEENRAKCDHPWFPGLIVMITRNNYNLEVFNGDIGLIMPDAESENSLSAYFPASDGFKKIPISLLPEFEPAFAMTVHKSQGSEYREVWLLPPSSENPAQEIGESEAFGLDNALLYTAITRARERFTFWGGQQIFSAAVGMKKERQTALKEILSDVFSGQSV